MRQDSTDPTGVAATGGDKKAVERARDRKANAAIQMKVNGSDYDEIAEVLGFPTARAALIAIEGALEKELHDEPSRRAMRGIASRRLERLLKSVWPKATDPEHPDHLVALTKTREIVLQWSKLHGLEAPAELVMHSPAASEIESWVADMVGTTVPQLEEASIFDDEDVVEGEIVEAQ